MCKYYLNTVGGNIQVNNNNILILYTDVQTLRTLSRDSNIENGAVNRKDMQVKVATLSALPLSYSPRIRGRWESNPRPLA